MQARFDRDRSTGILATHLHHVPFSRQVDRYFAAAQLLLLTSREDPFPSVVLEALACGLPVVAFDGSGGHCELLREPLNGVLAGPIEDVAALAHALRDVAGQESGERRLARAEAAKARFDFASYGWNLLRLFKPALTRVSVVIPNFNYERYIQERLETVFAQTYPVFEIIVLDDASTDSSIEVINRTCRENGRDIRLERGAENSGSVFKQWARGVRGSEGELIWIAEADDLAKPTFLEDLLVVFQEEPRALFAFSDSSQIDEAGKAVGDSYAPYCNEYSDFDFSADFRVSTERFLRQALAVKNNVLNVSSVLFRRDKLLAAINAVGHELPTWTIAGDWRLYVQLCRSEGEVAYIARPLNAHRRHGHSVVGANRLLAHIDEIARMHQIVRSAFSLSQVETSRQAAYLESLQSRAAEEQAADEAEWPGDVPQMCADAAAEFGVPSRVHIDDFIFRFLLNHPGFGLKSAAIEYYFRDGHRSATKVRAALDRWLPSSEEPLHVLEFASGYGAVTRHAKDILAPHQMDSCDIHPAAVRFLSRNFGVTAIQSSDVPERLELPVPYDMIFVLSFFSHMPDSTWARWLQRLYNGLNEGGVLLFTTHGKQSLKHFPEARLNSKGFWFDPSSEQKDLDTATYGQTITAKPYVVSKIAQLKDADLLEYEEGGWWTHQDVYIVRRGKREG